MVRTVTQRAVLGGGDFAGLLAGRKIQPLAPCVPSRYTLDIWGRRMPAPRPPLGAEGGGMVQAVGLPGAGRSPLHFNKKYGRFILSFAPLQRCKSKMAVFSWGVGWTIRTGEAWPDRRSLAGLAKPGRIQIITWGDYDPPCDHCSLFIYYLGGFYE